MDVSACGEGAHLVMILALSDHKVTGITEPFHAMTVDWSDAASQVSVFVLFCSSLCVRTRVYVCARRVKGGGSKSSVAGGGVEHAKAVTLSWAQTLGRSPFQVRRRSPSRW